MEEKERRADRLLKSALLEKEVQQTSQSRIDTHNNSDNVVFGYIEDDYDAWEEQTGYLKKDLYIGEEEPVLVEAIVFDDEPLVVFVDPVSGDEVEDVTEFLNSFKSRCDVSSE